MGYFSMPKYFQDMPVVGKPLVNANAENEAELKEIEKNIHDKVEEILAKGITTEEKLNERGQLSAMQRINALVDEGTFCPLNSLFNPNDNKMGSTNIINGLGRVNGKWAVSYTHLMKMETEIVAPAAGTVASVNVSVGDAVDTGAVLVTLN